MPTSVQVLDPTKTFLLDMTTINAVVVPQYQGEAQGVQPTFQFVVTSVSAAAAAVITVTAHGLNTDNTVTISGATGDWAALNGVRKVTVTGANTFTVAVDSSLFALTFNGVITTTAPRTSAACWRIIKNYYDGTPNLTRSSYAAGGGFNNVYDNRATLAYN